MNRVACFSGSGISLGASATSFGFLGPSAFSLTTTESRKALTYRTGGTFRNLFIQILTNDRGESTFRTRKGTADANIVVTITASGTGKFEDTSNTDAVTAGDNWHSKIITGAGGTVFTARTMLILFDATTNTVMRGGGSDV